MSEFIKTSVDERGIATVLIDRNDRRNAMSFDMLRAFIDAVGRLGADPSVRVLVVTGGDELKLVYPQDGGAPERYEALRFAHKFLQPMDGPARAANSRKAIDYCLAHPQWRLSMQTHKYLGIP